MLSTLAVHGYRSIRELVVPLGAITVVTGANGTGKSSLYRSLRLLAATASDGAVAALAREGGLPSTLWAGPEAGTRGASTQGTVRHNPISLRLGFASEEFSYAIDFGLPTYQGSTTSFGLDPEIKNESVWSGVILRPGSLLTERRGASVRIRGAGEWHQHGDAVAPWSSIFSEIADPEGAPELLALREAMRTWRFYDHVRTDAEAPARRSIIGTRTPVVASDGSDLAAALQTIRELGHAPDLAAAISRGLPGSVLEIDVADGRFTLGLRQAGLLRPLVASELSDGTLRYLLWVAALMSQRPGDLVVLNEPETSLHPDLLPALAALVVDASSRSQVIVVSHSPVLVDALAAAGALVHELRKTNGETVLSGQGLLDSPLWSWPTR